jgi:hypothetical protein
MTIAKNGAYIGEMTARPAREVCSQCKRRRFPGRTVAEVVNDALANGEFRCVFENCRARIPYTAESLDALQDAVKRGDGEAIAKAMQGLTPEAP